MYIDPAAAKAVFASGAPIRLVPLDATQRVPIDMRFLETLQSKAETPLARFVRRCSPASGRLSARDFILRGPAAAVVAGESAVATFKPLAIEISDKAQDLGRNDGDEEAAGECAGLRSRRRAEIPRYFQ